MAFNRTSALSSGQRMWKVIILTQFQCLKKLKEQNTLNLKPYLIKLNFLLAVEKTLENFTGLWAYYRHQLSLH